MYTNKYCLRRPGKYHDKHLLTPLKSKPQFLLLETEEALSEEAMNKEQSIFNVPLAGTMDIACTKPGPLGQSPQSATQGKN